MKLSLGRSLTKSMVAYFNQIYQFISFDGLVENVLSVESEDFNFKDNAPFSISCWYNVSTLANGQNLNVWRRGGGALSSEVISIRLNKANDITVTAIVRMYAENHTDGIYIINNIQNIKGWNHFAITFDGLNADGLKMYTNNLIVNNSVITNTLTSLNPNVYPNSIGLNADGNTPQHGSIDDLVIYDRVLNQSEITELYRHNYKAGIGGLSTYDNIISYWGFDGNLNDGKGTNHLASTLPIYEESNINAYLSESGNDVTAEINSEINKFKTLDSAIDAFVAVRGRYNFMYLEDGEYNTHTYSKTISNLSIIGTTIPIYDDALNPTRLINGTIIKGYGRFYLAKGIKLQNLGFDVGSAYVFGGGTENNALAFDGGSYSIYPTCTDHTLVNVITLCKSPTSLYHAAIFERVKGISINGLETAFAVHGIVFKCSEVNGQNLKAYGNNTDGFVVKKDISGQTVGNISINGFYYRNKIGNLANVIIAIGSEITGQPADDITLLNCDLDETSTLIDVGLATNVLIKDINNNILYP